MLLFLVKHTLVLVTKSKSSNTAGDVIKREHKCAAEKSKISLSDCINQTKKIFNNLIVIWERLSIYFF